MHHCTWLSLSPSHLQVLWDYRCAPQHLAFPVSLSPAGVSGLQMFTTAPGLPFLHVTCRSLGLQMFTTAPHLPCLHLTCRSVGLQMCTTASGLPCLPLTCRIVGITVLHHCTYPYLSLSHLQECQHYRFAPLYLAFSVSLSPARVS